MLTATLLKHQGFVTMALAGQACIHTSIGLALFAPVLMRAASVLLGSPLRKASGVSGYLAHANVRQRNRQTSGVLMPAILFVGMAAGGLYIQDILSAVNAAAGITQTAAEKAVQTLNFIVIAMIAVFAAVVLINIAVATTFSRRREFGQQRLIGSTPPQVLRMVGLESAVTVATGLVFGTIGALAAIIPYSIALDGKVLPSVGLLTYLGVVAAVVVLTFAANLGATRRAIQRPALEAVAGES